MGNQAKRRWRLVYNQRISLLMTKMNFNREKISFGKIRDKFSNAHESESFQDKTGSISSLFSDPGKNVQGHDTAKSIFGRKFTSGDDKGQTWSNGETEHKTVNVIADKRQECSCSGNDRSLGRHKSFGLFGAQKKVIITVVIILN